MRLQATSRQVCTCRQHATRDLYVIRIAARVESWFRLCTRKTESPNGSRFFCTVQELRLRCSMILEAGITAGDLQKNLEPQRLQVFRDGLTVCVFRAGVSVVKIADMCLTSEENCAIV